MKSCLASEKLIIWPHTCISSCPVPQLPEAGPSASEMFSLLVPVPLLALLPHTCTHFSSPDQFLFLLSGSPSPLQPTLLLVPLSLLSPIVCFSDLAPSLYTDLYFSFIPSTGFFVLFCFQLVLRGIHDLHSLIRDQPMCPAVEASES